VTGGSWIDSPLYKLTHELSELSREERRGASILGPMADLWQGLGHMKTSELGNVLESTVKRIERYLRRRGLLGTDEDGVDADADLDSTGATTWKREWPPDEATP
jgi:hypothetical protein